MQAQLKAAGINTNSKQYKAALKQMMSNANGEMYTNIQGIKNLMKNYDKDGDYIDPSTGLAGLLVTEENAESRKRIISIPESSRDEMFELTKKEFLRENGIQNGDTTRRSDVYTNLHRKMKKNDRLAAGYTMEKYERAYRQAFLDVVREVNPGWRAEDSVWRIGWHYKGVRGGAYEKYGQSGCTGIYGYKDIVESKNRSL